MRSPLLVLIAVLSMTSLHAQEAPIPAEVVPAESQPTEEVLEEIPAETLEINEAELEEVEKLVVDTFTSPEVKDAVSLGMRNKTSVVVEYPVDGSAPKATLGTTTAAKIPSEKKSKKRPASKIGLLLDVGIPDGVGASIVYRPGRLRWLRLHGGATHNAISPGIRAGATLIPFNFAITPTATVEAGHYFEGDGNWIVHKLRGEKEYDNPTLRRVSYDYANGHVGIELGSQKRALLYVHGGFSYLRSNINNFQEFIDQQQDSDSKTSVTAKDPKVTIIGPSGKVGLLFYFW